MIFYLLKNLNFKKVSPQKINLKNSKIIICMKLMFNCLNVI